MDNNLRVDPLFRETSTDFLDVRDPLLVIGHVAVSSHSNNVTSLLNVREASQCILTLCEKTLSLERVNGTTRWVNESTNFGRLVELELPKKVLHYSYGEFPSLCWQAEDGDVDLIRTHGEYFYQFVDKSKRAFCELEYYADKIAQRIGGQKSGIVVTLHNRSDLVYVTESAISPSPRNLSQKVESIATALTNYGLQTTNDTVLGYAYAEESFVRVRWLWIILPASLELASLVLLILTIIDSRRKDVPLWKSSVLALIYHGVNELYGRDSLATEQLSGMEVTAKTTDVQLVKNEEGVNSLSRRSGHCAVEQDK